MYPELFRIGNFQISSFGLMVALAFLSAYWVSSLEFKRKGIEEKLLGNLFIAAMVGGIGGAKILYLIENVPLSNILDNPFSYILSRGGLTFYGGFIGAIILIFYVTNRSRFSFWVIVDAVTPGLILAYAIGRIGCFLVGDDYGIPSNLPWAMSFPKGLPPTDERVHPTQIYDVLIMALVFILFWRLRLKPTASGWLFSLYLIITGSERFLIEFIRSTTPSPIPNLSVAQIIAILIILVGAIKLIKIHSSKNITGKKR